MKTAFKKINPHKTLLLVKRKDDISPSVFTLVHVALRLSATLVTTKCSLGRSLFIFFCPLCVFKLEPEKQLRQKTRGIDTAPSPSEHASQARQLAACSAKGVPSFLSYFKTLSIGPAPGITPATSPSAVKRSTD